MKKEADKDIRSERETCSEIKKEEERYIGMDGNEKEGHSEKRRNCKAQMKDFVPFYVFSLFLVGAESAKSPAAYSKGAPILSGLWKLAGIFSGVW